MNNFGHLNLSLMISCRTTDLTVTLRGSIHLLIKHAKMIITCFFFPFMQIDLRIKSYHLVDTVQINIFAFDTILDGAYLNRLKF